MPSPVEKPSAHEHADFDATYRYTWHVPLALHDLHVHLFDAFPDLHKINVELVLPSFRAPERPAVKCCSSIIPSISPSHREHPQLTGDRVLRAGLTIRQR